MNAKRMATAIIVIVALLFGGITTKLIFFPVHTVSKSVDLAYDVVDNVLTDENAIRDYEWFKQQEADIRKCLANEEIAQAAYDNYTQNLPEDRTQWSDFDKREEASLRNSLIALQKVTNNAIEDYNARSEMVNRSIFKDNLPSNISRAWYAGLELTE